MKRQRILVSVLALGLGLTLVAGLALAQGPVVQGEMSVQAAVGTAFTYQGRLTDGGSPANGTYDLELKLYDDPTAGSQVGSTVTKEDVAVTDGLFTVELDFGSGVFTGDARWLEIAVRPGASTGAYTTLSPRQALTPAPYALALPGLWTQQNTTSPNVIGGYSGNDVTDGVVGATIGGGGDSGLVNRVTANYGTVGGGRSNVVTATHATVGGGRNNTASGDWATVGGGVDNTASGLWAIVGGGVDNTASDDNATVGGGWDNIASGGYATIGGGALNVVTAARATVGGGYHNVITGTAEFATIPGGRDNRAEGRYSFAAGRRAKANHHGAFVWADSTNADFASTANDQFAVRANGGVVFSTGGASFQINGGDAWTSANDGSGSGLDADLLDGQDGPYYLDWNNLANVPTGFADGLDDTDDTVSWGEISGIVGSGANQVAAGDHTHDDRYYTESELQTSGSASVHWGNLTNVPAGFADGVDDDTLGELSCSNGQIAEWDGSVWVCGDDDTGPGGDFWSLTGNAGTNPATNFLGTTDNQALELRVNNARALRLEPNATSPNLIGGYRTNSVTSGVVGATIGGGGTSGFTNRVTDNYGTVAGGEGNQAGDDAGATNDSRYATVGGGRNNSASGSWATVGGGVDNTASGYAATVGGGHLITVTAAYATAGGGISNSASGLWAIVGGGSDNTASGQASTVGGGYGNLVSGWYATVPGGDSNTAQGNYSFAAGRRAKANHQGAFVWSDSKYDTDFESQRDHQFLVRAYGGSRFEDGTGLWVELSYLTSKPINTSTGAYLSDAGIWTNVSDRNAKENFAPVDGREVLVSLARVPISTWNHKAQEPSVRHIGPTAQDFYAAFGLGDSDKAISTLDADGVALAAIQGLYQVVQEKDAQIAAQQQRIDDLETRVAALEQAVGASPSSPSNLPGGWWPLFLGGLVVAAGVVVQRRHPGGGQ